VLHGQCLDDVPGTDEPAVDPDLSQQQGPARFVQSVLFLVRQAPEIVQDIRQAGDRTAAKPYLDRLVHHRLRDTPMPDREQTVQVIR
jgi:hypothetical protein